MNSTLSNKNLKKFPRPIRKEPLITPKIMHFGPGAFFRSFVASLINDVNQKKSNVVVSAGNTGALFVISKLNMNMIENINKPALAALWPNKIGMNIVLDLGANVECDEKNFEDFAILGSALHKALFPNDE